MATQNTPKPAESKKLTDAQRIDALIKLLETNGMTIPKELK